MAERGPTRPYSSPLRAERAERTRRAILTAAHRLFVRHGFTGTTIETIAAAAEVAVPTVYVTFGSKHRILSTLVAEAGGDPDIRRLAARTMAELDPERRLRDAARVMRRILEREAELLALLMGAGSDDPALEAAWRQMHANRRATLTRALEPLAERRQLREGLALARAVDTVWALSSPELYRLLVSGRGWTPVTFERWLAETIITLILGGAAGEGSSRGRPRQPER